MARRTRRTRDSGLRRERIKKYGGEVKKFLCRHPGCSAILDNPGYCDKHIAYHNQNKAKPFENARRSNENLYHTSEWRQLRERTIRCQGRCANCGSSKRLEVHHINPPRGNVQLFFNERNLLVLCHECHDEITRYEILQRRNKKWE